MEIVLSDELDVIFQYCVDTIDSYTDPENPQAVTNVCLSFQQEICDNPDFVREMPSYLALALFRAVRLKNELACIGLISQGQLPNWHDIQIKKSCVELVRIIREIDDDLAKKAVVVAFCLSHSEKISCDGVSIVRTIEMPPEEKGEQGYECCE